MRSFFYNGQMEFQNLNDACIRTNYQHEHVVKTFKKDIEGKKVLDAGCWTGTLEGEIKKEGIKCELVGSDINKDALATARRNFPEYTFQELDLINPPKVFLEKYKNFFDTVFILDVIEHVPQDTETAVLKTLGELLKPDGSLVLSTMYSHIFNFIDPAWFLGHRHYSKKQMLSMLEEGGFKLTKLDLIGNIYWDIDMLILYIYKHIFHRQYKTSVWMYKKIFEGLVSNQTIPTRFYLQAKKK
ncbi:class I SAM-dependent methyltransferase [Patescibacteria group bacterium]|nr:class I SAM-dependent methyltransferase [Patescibacteria group bacterium]MBU1953032.1 class I SAM-dependent methyltransferase [Patescibacteria group bacterium]